MEKRQLTQDIARAFYAVHKERPFYNELVDFITSGPVVVLALEKENAIKALDKISKNPSLEVIEMRKQFENN